MKKVLIGVSGGVDSAVAIHQLLNCGYEVCGIHFSLDGNSKNFTSAKAVCDFFGIKLIFISFQDRFQNKVFSPFIEGFQAGITPNLCVLCNQHIKFGSLFDYAMQNGFDYIATGHYCGKREIDGRTFLVKGIDEKKDQTYFLNQISEKSLEKTLFPLSNLNKETVRKIAEKLNLPNAQKKGSTDICLMEGLSFGEFLKPHLKPKQGLIKTQKGEIVGKHNGLYNYTLGQRKGIGLGGKSGESGRWFVYKKDVENNILYVTCGDEKPLYSTVIDIKNCNWIGFDPSGQFNANVKTRYRGEVTKASVNVEGNMATVVLSEMQRAVTCGQYCVFYDDDVCLGGGEIVESRIGETF